LKAACADEGVRHAGGRGGDWAVRLSVAKAPNIIKTGRRRLSFVMYIGDEDEPSIPWRVLPSAAENLDLKDGVELVTGGSAALGSWTLHAQESSGTKKQPSRLDYLAMPTEGQSDYFLYVRELMLGVMYEQMERNPSSDQFQLNLPNGATTNSNLALFQVTMTVPGAVDFVFLNHGRKLRPEPTPKGSRTQWSWTGSGSESGSGSGSSSGSGSGGSSGSGSGGSGGGSSGDAASGGGDEAECGSGLPPEDDATSVQRVGALSGDMLSVQLADAEKRFQARFSYAFLGGKPVIANDPHHEMLQSSLSELLGSMGYSHGTSKVRVRNRGGGKPSSYMANTQPGGLYASVPSRSFAPRPTMASEGFNQLLLMAFDPLLQRDSLAHWLDLMAHDGWIAGTQLLGEGARARVPPESVVQDPILNMAPPTLWLPLSRMVVQMAPWRSDREEGANRRFLARAWPRLVAMYSWYNATLRGPIPTTYRWPGRNTTTTTELNPLTPGSGMPDYPRSSHPNEDSRDVDSRCWVAIGARTMATLGVLLARPISEINMYKTEAAQLTGLPILRPLHMDQATGHFLDFGLHTEDVELQRTSYPVEGQVQEFTHRVVNVPPTPRRVKCYGYVSLFPLLFGLIDTDDEMLGRQLDLLTNPELLWSSVGVRSLSPGCVLYGRHNAEHQPPEYRGHIHVGINILVLDTFARIATSKSRWASDALAAYGELRRALLKAIKQGYANQGYAFERYDDATGEGVGAHPYSLLTPLIALEVNQWQPIVWALAIP
ncbi:hypothetical protein FOA52_005325, partial [Chlamydomonas sp. UWO 241]